MSQISVTRRVSYVRAGWRIALAVGALSLLAAGLLYRSWLPPLEDFIESRLGSPPPLEDPDHHKHADRDDDHDHDHDHDNAHDNDHDNDHGHDDHDHPGHDDASAISMTAQARKNLGLRVEAIELKPYVKSIVVPGMVVERPGRSVIEVTALMTGVIERIHPIEGEAVSPGQPLFNLRMTHEELVQLQANLLQTAEELNITDREIERIEALTQKGAIAAKALLERQYDRQKLEAALRSTRQALLLHGLSEEQIARIIEDRQLLRELVVAAPTEADDGTATPASAVYQVQELRIAQGQHVSAGDTLAVLADHAELYIEGEAFERDVALISRAATAGAQVTAILDTEGGRPETISNLKVLYLASKVDPAKRTQDFFVTLPNVKQRDDTLENGHRFIAWKYRPGQRVQLQIPVETLPNRFVVPIDAVAQDGVETYVFTPNGDHFDRIAVHVEHRDTIHAVIANDGSIFPGDLLAMNGARQLQRALKNRSGGGIDPHAGHNH